MTIFYPVHVAAIRSSVLLGHELGHYYSALHNDGNPDPPYVVPLGVGAIGITRVRNLPLLSRKSKKKIIAAGPVAGTVTALALMPFAVLFGGKLVITGLVGLAGIELYNGTLGSDGKKLKKERCFDGNSR